MEDKKCLLIHVLTKATYFLPIRQIQQFSVKYETKIMSNTQSLIYSLSMNQFIIMLAKITIFFV